MSSSWPTLYSFRRCPYAMRARLALSVAEQTCVHREVWLRERPAELRTVSPKATVPVLVLTDGRAIEESLEIMLWALEQRDRDGWLRNAEQQAEALELIACCDGEFKQHLDRYKYSERHAGADREEERELGAAFLRQLELRLEHNAFLMDARISLADMAVAPFVRQFAATDSDWFEAQPWPKLGAWLTAFVASPLFLGCMRKLPTWEPDSAPLLIEWGR